MDVGATRPAAHRVGTGVRRLLLVLAVLVVPLAGCASEWTDQEPRSATHDVPAGYRVWSYHGVSLDVPEDAAPDHGPWCSPGLPSEGALVVPLADYGAVNCPAQVGGRSETAPPRPSDVVTVVLTVLGGRPDLGLPDPRYVDEPDAGVTVAVSGPADRVSTIVGSVRLAAQDDDGCDAELDPSVAPSNVASDSIVPADVGAVSVCEYAPVHDDGSGPLWLVGSTALDDDRVASVTALLRAAPTIEGGAVTDDPFGPVLRLRIRGGDGNIRTLQAVTNIQPEPVTDGHRTVGVDLGGTAGGIPTPFDVS